MKPLSGKPKKCAVKSCRASFVPTRPFMTWCSPECGLILASEKQAREVKVKAKAERDDIRARKERLKTKGDYLREAQQAFNLFIRLRDRLAGHPCISSGKPLDWSGNQTDAGHWRSVGSAPHLRFDERNCHAQSKIENRYLRGNPIDYRAGLISRIGLAEVEALEADQSVKKYTLDDLKEIRDRYRAKARDLKKQIEAQ